MGSFTERVRAAALAFLADDSAAMRRTGTQRAGMGLRMSPAAAHALDQQRRQAVMARQAAAIPADSQQTPNTSPQLADPDEIEAAKAAARAQLDMMTEDEKAALARQRLGPGMSVGNWAGLATLPSNPEYRGAGAQPGVKAQRGIPAMAWLPRDPRQPRG